MERIYEGEIHEHSDGILKHAIGTEWKTRVILIHLENYFGEYAQEVWERNWMNPKMHAMLFDTKCLNASLFNMYNPILKALREQSKEDDQMKSAGETSGSVPETLLDWESILKERAEQLLEPNDAR